MSIYSHIFFLLASLLLFSACEEFTQWELVSDPERQLVVEAILTNERITQEIRLSQTFDSPNGTVPPVMDALVEIEANGQSYSFDPDPIDSGLYRSQIPFPVLPLVQYTLTIHWKDSSYTATSMLSEVAPLDSVQFRPVGQEDSLLRLRDFVPIYDGTQQAMVEVEIDWSHLSAESPNRARQYFYTFSSIHVNQLIRPQREIVSFPKGSLVAVKKYGLNDDFATFLLSMVTETDWNGNFYYAVSGNAPGNISNGAYGFFSTCAVLSDTVIAQ